MAKSKATKKTVPVRRDAPKALAGWPRATPAQLGAFVPVVYTWRDASGAIVRRLRYDYVPHEAIAMTEQIMRPAGAVRVVIDVALPPA